MKAVFGVVSLLLALAIVGLVAVRQLKTLGQTGPLAAAPQASANGAVREQAVQLESKIANDVAKAMAAGAAARENETEKP